MIRALVAIVLCLGCGDDPSAPRDAGPDGPRPDARRASCGLELPGVNCTDPGALDRCDGINVMTVSCDAGLTCGTDPVTGVGASCLRAGDPCGMIGPEGVCSGPIFTRCDDDKLDTFDCRSVFGICSSGRCTHACELAGVTSNGRCLSNTLQRCVFEDGEYRVESLPCPAGSTCVNQPETGNPGCSTTPVCGALGSTGECDGNRLRRCVRGNIETTNCATGGGVCTWGGDDLGHVCAPAGTAGTLVITGTVRYQDRAPRMSGYGPIVPRPARGAGVTVIDDRTGRPLGAGVADDEGHYEVRYDSPEGAAVHVLAVSVVPGKLRPARVLRPDGLLHGFGSPSFAAGLTSTVDLLVTERSGAAQAFNILDQLVSGLDQVRTLLVIDDPDPVQAIWVKGTRDGTYVEGTTMSLLGSIADDDGYDDPVILHELGHYVENAYGRTDNPGGGHVIHRPEAPPLAWSEGFATWFSSVVRGDPQYVDVMTLGGLRFDIDEDVTKARADLPMTQDLSENTVSEILWDLGDGGEGDDDPAAGNPMSVVHVEDMYLRQALILRGATGIDLVDFFDGFLFLAGPEACAGVRGVAESRSFPYDFAGPTTCP